MPVDLEKHFATSLDALAAARNTLELSTGSLAAPIPRLFTKEIRCYVGHQNYGPVCMQMVDLYASKSALRALGLLIFSVLLSPGRTECIVCFEAFDKSNSESAWMPRRYLVIEKPGPVGVVGCLVESSVEACSYRYETVSKFPWAEDLPADYSQLPIIGTGEFGDLEHSPVRFEANEAVTGFGSIEASVRAASLFLNLGHPESRLVECCLEGEPGFRGVGPLSAELRIHLPGGCHWEYRDSH